MITEAQLDNWFTYHRPTEAQQKAYAEIRAKARTLAGEIANDGLAANIDLLMEAVETLCPNGVERQQAEAALSQIEDLGLVDLDDEDRDEAVAKLREVVMWANAAIACAAPSPAIEPAPPPAEAAASELAPAAPAPAMLCPRRAENGMMPGGPFNVPDADHWHPERNTCSWCGSLNPDEAMRRILAGAEVSPTDKDYKVYLHDDDAGRAKFYFQHFSTEQRIALVEAVNAGKVKFGYPGRFYVLPFFMRKSTASESTEAAR